MKPPGIKFKKPQMEHLWLFVMIQIPVISEDPIFPLVVGVLGNHVIDFHFGLRDWP